VLYHYQIEISSSTMIGPLTGTPREILPISYDLEWVPETFVLRLVGVWDFRGYRQYHTIQDFLESELNESSRGHVFFAHAGGKFDVQFVLEALVQFPEYEVTASFSGASAVRVVLKKDKHVWTFADSFFLLKGALKEVGKTIGRPKTECAFDAPLDELAIYNENDCRIVQEALDGLQREVMGLGGEMRTTLASTAMALFRRVYLSRKIPTSKKLNDTLRASYCASRVEVFAKKADFAEYYDINSSFPYSMTFPLPGALKGTLNRIPRGEHAIYFALARVKVPEMPLPPLPFKHGQRIFFPTGEWEGWFSRVDLELLETVGGTILEVDHAYIFEAFNDLADYVKNLYAKRKEETRKAGDNKAARERGETEPFPGAELRSYTIKLLLNSLYGKFAERSLKEAILINPAHPFGCPHKKRQTGNIREGEGRKPAAPPQVEHEDGECVERLAPGIFRIEEERNVAHAHVAISSYVTALSRAHLYHPLAACKQRYYCDTDSIACGQGEMLPTSEELGDLKHEGTIKDAHFVCPKVYAFTEVAGGKRILKCKGFRSLRKEDFDDEVKYTMAIDERFKKISGHEPVPLERVRGIREGLRDTKGFGIGWSKVKTKRIHEHTFPKRAPEGVNGTRPWTVEEIEASA
jgi:hypothetical protein